MENEAHWYAVKVFYNRVFDMEARLNPYGIETYVASNAVKVEGRDHSSALKKLADENDHLAHRMYVQIGPVIYKKKPLVNSLLFARADKDQLAILEGFMQDKDSGKKYGFIYKDSSWKNYSKIPDKQIEDFRRVTSSGDTGLKIYTGDKIINFKTGDKVRVTDGPLKGTEGYIKRINKDRRLLVCIEGVIAVATSYIPQKQLEKVTD